jgi:hypothetical protein
MSLRKFDKRIVCEDHPRSCVLRQIITERIVDQYGAVITASPGKRVEKYICPKCEDLLHRIPPYQNQRIKGERRSDTRRI